MFCNLFVSRFSLPRYKLSDDGKGVGTIFRLPFWPFYFWRLSKMHTKEPTWIILHSFVLLEEENGLS